MTRRSWWVGALCALSLGTRVAHAQSSGDLFAEGIRAYRNLDFDHAAGLLRREAARLSASGALTADQAKALVYLGAADLFRGRRDSAAAVFHRLIMLDPRYRPDRLIFPPEVTMVFDGVRQDTKTLVITVPRDTTIPASGGSFRVWLIASSFQMVDVTLRYEDGGPYRPLYYGPISDSVSLQWDGLDAAGAIPVASRVLLRVASHAPTGELTGIQQLPLDLRVLRVDTLPWPPPPADSQLLPERSASRPAVRALVGGALLSSVVVSLPAVVGGTDARSAPRLAVAGTVGLAGLLGYILHRPGRPVQASIRANRAVREAWDQTAAAVKAENERRLTDIHLAIRAGEPTTIRPGGP